MKHTSKTNIFIVGIFFSLVALLTIILVSQTATTNTDIRSRASTNETCIKTGCSGTLCSDTERISTCEYKPEYICFSQTTCGRLENGECGWLDLEKLNSCLVEHRANPITPASRSTPKPCRKTGCSSQLCADQEIITTCEIKPEYACYNNATCTRLQTGLCGWLEQETINQCLEGKKITPTPTGQQSVIPNAPAWFFALPANLRGFLENLYLTIFVWERVTPLRHLLDGLI